MTYVLDQSKEEHGQTAQVGRELETTTADATTGKLLAVGRQQLNNLRLKSFTSGLQTAAQGTLNGLVAEECGHSLLISRSIDVGQVRGSRQSNGDDPNPALTVAGGVKNGGLQAHNRLGHGLVDSNLNDVGLITGERGERAKIGAAVEEVTVEGAHAQASGGTHSEHSLQTDLRGEILGELTGKLHGILRSGGVPARVEVGLTTSVPGQAAKRGNVLVLGREEEHIDGHLSLGAFHRKALIEGVGGLQKRGLLARTQHLLILAHRESTVADVGQGCAQHRHLSSNGRDQLITGT